MPTLGERIKAERERRGWTQRDLADAAGLTQQAIYLYEKEQRYPSLKAARQVAAALEMGVDDLVRGTAALDVDHAPVDVWAALGWPATVIADGVRDWPQFTAEQRLELVRDARALYEQQQALQAKLRGGQKVPKPETT